LEPSSVASVLNAQISSITSVSADKMPLLHLKRRMGTGHPMNRARIASPAHGGATGVPANSVSGATLKPKYRVTTHHAALLRGLAGPLLEYATRLTQIAWMQVRLSPCLLIPRYLRKPSPGTRSAGGQISFRRRRRDANDVSRETHVRRLRSPRVSFGLRLSGQ
jgi:hypothetical protein